MEIIRGRRGVLTCGSCFHNILYNPCITYDFEKAVYETYHSYLILCHKGVSQQLSFSEHFAEVFHHHTFIHASRNAELAITPYFIKITSWWVRTASPFGTKVPILSHDSEPNIYRSIQVLFREKKSSGTEIPKFGFLVFDTTFNIEEEKFRAPVFHSLIVFPTEKWFKISPTIVFGWVFAWTNSWFVFLVEKKWDKMLVNRSESTSIHKKYSYCFGFRNEACHHISVVSLNERKSKLHHQTINQRYYSACKLLKMSDKNLFF